MRSSSTRDLHELPKFRDGLTFLYVEHASIEQEAKAIAIYNKSGSSLVPVAALGTLMLGPGTRITHAAIKALSENGVTTVWVGEDMTRYYSSGTGETRSARNIIRQATVWADSEKHMMVVIRMYRKRFIELLPQGLDLRQIRGREGVRVRETYAFWSRETGVTWNGRNYDRKDWHESDPINRSLSTGASVLYGLCHAAIVSSGFSPALGFIHTGKQLSFVYDIADLYKSEILIPAAFQAVAQDSQCAEQNTRLKIRQRFKETRLLDRIVDDIESLFEGFTQQNGGDTDEQYQSDAAMPGQLWDPVSEVSGGVDYGSDDTGENT